MTAILRYIPLWHTDFPGCDCAAARQAQSLFDLSTEDLKRANITAERLRPCFWVADSLVLSLYLPRSGTLSNSSLRQWLTCFRLGREHRSSKGRDTECISPGVKCLTFQSCSTQVMARSRASRHFSVVSLPAPSGRYCRIPQSSWCVRRCRTH